jgi:uncharacterized membrane protein YoaK (UPF0700 family)
VNHEIRYFQFKRRSNLTFNLLAATTYTRSTHADKDKPTHLCLIIMVFKVYIIVGRICSLYWWCFVQIEWWTSPFKVFSVVRDNIGGMNQKARIDIIIVIVIFSLVYCLQYTSFEDTCNSNHALATMTNNPIRQAWWKFTYYYG